MQIHAHLYRHCATHKYEYKFTDRLSQTYAHTLCALLRSLRRSLSSSLSPYLCCFVPRWFSCLLAYLLLKISICSIYFYRRLCYFLVFVHSKVLLSAWPNSFTFQNLCSFSYRNGAQTYLHGIHSTLAYLVCLKTQNTKSIEWYVLSLRKHTK